MRRTVRGRLNKSKNKKDRLYTIIAFFIAAPIIAIVLGNALVQYLILPQIENEEKASGTIEESYIENQDDQSNFNNDTVDKETNPETGIIDTANDDPKQETANIEETTFFGIQIGSFSSLENADSFLKELEGNNINGYIVKSSSYKVFSGEFSTKEEAYNHLEKIKKIYVDAFVSSASKKETNVLNPD